MSVVQKDPERPAAKIQVAGSKGHHLRPPLSMSRHVRILQQQQTNHCISTLAYIVLIDQGSWSDFEDVIILLQWITWRLREHTVTVTVLLLLTGERP